MELTNLNRQILHWDNDIGKKKAESADEKLKKINPDVEVEVISKTIDAGNVDELVGDFDMIVDSFYIILNGPNNSEIVIESDDDGTIIIENLIVGEWLINVIAKNHNDEDFHYNYLSRGRLR